MKQGRTISGVLVYMAIVLVTQSGVYAAHLIAGGGTYTVTSSMAEIAVRCQFLGVLTDPANAPVPVFDTHIECDILNPSGSMPFRLFTSGTEVLPFTVVDDPQDQNQDLISMSGKMLSKLVLGVAPDEQHFTEVVNFEMNAVDAALPGAGMDSMTIRLDYRSTESTAPLLLQNLGADLVICNADICTLTLAGVLTEGEIESHH